MPGPKSPRNVPHPVQVRVLATVNAFSASPEFQQYVHYYRLILVHITLTQSRLNCNLFLCNRSNFSHFFFIFIFFFLIAGVPCSRNDTWNRTAHELFARIVHSNYNIVCEISQEQIYIKYCNIICIYLYMGICELIVRVNAIRLMINMFVNTYTCTLDL